MPWLVGIDEAGYGPNLGPFVMTLVACRSPDHGCLWNSLKSHVRRADEEADERLIVADSKQVYSSAGGFDELEKTALAVNPHPTLAQLLESLAIDDMPQLRQEAWFAGDTALPCAIDADALGAACKSWREASEAAGVRFAYIRSVIVAAPRFNDLIDRWDSKSAVLSVALTELMRSCLSETDAEPMRFVIDKHGGRNTYSALLQHACGDGMVTAEEEGRARSVYRVQGLDRPVQVLVTPKADVEQFCVALASMISKYVRELLMREFNRYWLTHVPDLAPTAGYPNDAPRFFEAIRPAMKKMGLAERLVWRSR
jgi:ribonuclease HII